MVVNNNFLHNSSLKKNILVFPCPIGHVRGVPVSRLGIKTMPPERKRTFWCYSYSRHSRNTLLNFHNENCGWWPAGSKWVRDRFSKQCSTDYVNVTDESHLAQKNKQGPCERWSTSVAPSTICHDGQIMNLEDGPEYPHIRCSCVSFHTFLIAQKLVFND